MYIMYINKTIGVNIMQLDLFFTPMTIEEEERFLFWIQTEHRLVDSDDEIAMAFALTIRENI